MTGINMINISLIVYLVYILLNDGQCLQNGVEYSVSVFRDNFLSSVKMCFEANPRDKPEQMQDDGIGGGNTDVGQHLEEIAVVVRANAVVDEEAVVVKFVDTEVAVSTMVESGVLEVLAREAEFDMAAGDEVEFVQFASYLAVELF